jgi:hypothetical protein
LLTTVIAIRAQNVLFHRGRSFWLNQPHMRYACPLKRFQLRSSVPPPGARRENLTDHIWHPMNSVASAEAKMLSRYVEEIWPVHIRAAWEKQVWLGDQPPTHFSAYVRP